MNGAKASELDYAVKRHKIRIPEYTLGEELINSISHGIGALLGVAALVLCVVVSAGKGNVYGIVSGSIYGLSLIVLYAVSSVYHGLKVNKAKRVFRVLDHCSVFILIAGTYTPLTLALLRDTVGWPLFFAVWATAILGIVLNAIDIERFEKPSLAAYIALGWIIVLAINPLREVLDPMGIILLVAGGVCYTVGAGIFKIGIKVRYMHSLWHFFVLAGSILHFFAIFLYVL